MRTPELKLPAVHVGANPASLLDQQRPGGHVPWVQSELPKRVQPPTGDIREIEGRGPRAPHAMREHRELIVEMHVHVLMPLAGRKSGRREAVLDVGDLRDANGSAI